MTCRDENHKKLEDEQLENLLKDVLRDHEKSMLLVQNILHTSNYCESEFLAVMVNVAVSICVNAINYLQVGDKFTKTQALDMVLGGIAANEEIKLAVLNPTDLLAKVREATGATTH